MTWDCFLSIAWPFIMLYYLLKTREAKGRPGLRAIAGVYAGALSAGTWRCAIYLRVSVISGVWRSFKALAKQSGRGYRIWLAQPGAPFDY